MNIRSGALRMAIGAALAGVLVAPATVQAVPSPDAPARIAAKSEMTRKQARKAYRDAACPLNATLYALEEAEAAPGATWATVQPLVRQAADKQIRAAKKFESPKHPWPKPIRRWIPAFVNFDYTAAGSNYVLADSASLEQYRAHLKALQDDLPKGLLEVQKALMAAKPRVWKWLGFPSTGACKAN